MSVPNILTPASASYAHGSSASPEVFSPIASNDQYYRVKSNLGFAMSEVLSRSPGVGVLDGLALSTVSGLSITVGAGFALNQGIIDVAADITGVAVPPSSTSHIWLSASGTITAGTTTPPAGRQVYLGSVVTGVSSVTSISTNGVVYIRGGGLWRSLASTPSDSPASSIRAWTQVGTSLYLWDGTAWREVADATYQPTWRKFAVGFADLQVASTSKQLTVASMAAGTVVHAAEIRVTTALAGTSISALTLSLGRTGATTAFVGAFTGLALGNGTYGGTSFESSASAVDLVLEALATGANLSALNAGVIEVHALLSKRR